MSEQLLQLALLALGARHEKKLCTKLRVIMRKQPWTWRAGNTGSDFYSWECTQAAETFLLNLINPKKPFEDFNCAAKDVWTSFGAKWDFSNDFFALTPPPSRQTFTPHYLHLGRWLRNYNHLVRAIKSFFFISKILYNRRTFYHFLFNFYDHLPLHYRWIHFLLSLMVSICFVLWRKIIHYTSHE